MPIMLKMIFSVFFGLYFIYFLFSKNYVKTYIPFMGLGYLLGPFGWDLLPGSIHEPALLFLQPAIFLLGIQMGKGLGKKFWENFPIETFFYHVGEKFLLILLFLIIFFLAVPSFVAVPISFPFYLSIAAFSSSFFFMHFISPRFRNFISAYYELNNLILMGLFMIFSLVFATIHETAYAFPFYQKILALLVLTAMILLMFKAAFREKRSLVVFWLTLILLGAAFSRIIGLPPMILGFFAGILSNFMPLRKQLILKKFFFIFNEYLILLLLILAGFFMELSLPLLLTGLLYLLVRISARLLISFFNFRKLIVKDFFQKSIFSLFQGEYFLAFLIYYALEYQFNAILNIALISLIFSEFLINYYYYRFVGHEKKHQGGSS